MTIKSESFLSVSEGTKKRMRAVKQKHTAPEIRVRKLLHSLGYRFRLHKKDLPGRPDIILPKYRTVIFVHGCFWHGHENCARATLPKNNFEIWKTKIETTKKRDQKNYEALENLGWRIIYIWECETKTVAAIEKSLQPLLILKN